MNDPTQTEGPSLGDTCNPTVAQHGEVVFTTGIGPAKAVERWVKLIARTSGQPVDWHYSFGWAHVLAIGDLECVRQAIRETMGEHDTIWREDYKTYLNRYPEGTCPYRPKWWTSRDETMYGDKR